MTLTLSQVAAALGVDLVGEDRMFSQISINTRTVEPGDLFIAIKGENFDAHQFLHQAEQKGACGLVVEQCCSSALPQICVADTRVALGDIASLWSSAFTLPIIAITGSCGKTTVKEMTAAILGQSFKKGNTQENPGHALANSAQESKALESKVLATRGNLNNEIGVPLTLLRLNSEHEAAVIELGANHKGEIKQLVNIVQPDVAVITNATYAHIEGFGSLSGVAEAKAEIYTGLGNGGTAVINADDTFASYWQEYCQELNEHEQNGTINTLTFGLDKPADICADYKQLADGIELIIKTPKGKQAVSLKQFGKHAVYNALAATAAAISSGYSLEDVKRGLETFTNVSGRLEEKQGFRGAKIFDDTYNANPGSVLAGIEAIQQIARQHSDSESVLILGDMGELGKESKQLHYQLGVDVAGLGVQKLFAVGSNCLETCKGFNSSRENQSSGFHPAEGSHQAEGSHETEGSGARHFKNKDELIHAVKKSLHRNSVVLVKGSRTMAMENVVDALVATQVKNKPIEGVQ